MPAPSIIVEIPLTARPQYFSVTLNSIPYYCKLYWLVPAQCWVLDLMDQEQNLLIGGIPLITGTDLLGQYFYIIEGNIAVISDQLPPDTVPDFVHLGVTGHVYYAPPGQDQ